MLNKVSVLIAAYNEEESLNELYNRIVYSLNSLEKKISDYEIWFVNDGSTDHSEKIIKELINETPNPPAMLGRIE